MIPWNIESMRVWSAPVELLANVFAALFLITGFVRSLVALLRSEWVEWLRGKGETLGIQATQAFANAFDVPPREQRPLDQLTGSLVTAVMLYLFAGLLFAFGMVTVLKAGLRYQHAPTWGTLALLLVGSALCMPGRYFQIQGAKARCESNLRWTQCRFMGWRAYIALASTPVLLVALAFGLSLAGA